MRTLLRPHNNASWFLGIWHLPRTPSASACPLQVLFLQGGASAQFAAVPLNLTAEGDTVDHIVTGAWSKKAAEEARKYCTVNVAAKGDNVSVPQRSSWQLSSDATYVHYCDNETIQVRRLHIRQSPRSML